MKNLFKQFLSKFHFFPKLTNKETCKLKEELQQIKKLLLDQASRNDFLNLMSHQEIILELYLDKVYNNNINKEFNFNQLTRNVQNINISCWTENKGTRFDGLPNLFYKKNYDITTKDDKKYADCYFLWGTQAFNGQIEIIKKAIYTNKPLFICEGGFLSSIETWAYKKNTNLYHTAMSFMIDDLAPYYDARKKTRLEIMLNDKKLIISQEQKLRAKKLIDLIIKQKLSKYNHQPIFTPSIGFRTSKVLVIDQTYGDMSITKGLANEQTFKIMLKKAIEDNPNADIIIKTHPDVISGAKGYFSDIKPFDNVYIYTEEINPICLLQYVDKVYACSSQMGFEALMCGKETHIFGLPFYAGWGASIDYQNCPRRQNKRSIEEIFYITYILYTKYIDYKKNIPCEIEDTINNLINLREKYFSEKGIKL